MGSPINCQLTFYSNVHHMRQILAGYKILHRERVINLASIRFDTDWLKEERAKDVFVSKGSLVKATINNHVIVYDMHDSARLNDEALSACDIYIKRSYSSQHHAKHTKIHPLGLYLNAVVGKIDLDRAKLMNAFATGSGRLIGIINSLTGRDYPSHAYIERSLDTSLPPKALFLARLWAPGEAEDANQREEREYINQNRTECVLTLRKEFGDRFLGGITADAYSSSYCKEAIVQDTNITKRRNYMKILSDYPICISTVGLHGSTGAKFSEYVAFGKAIISEKLVYDLPPNMKEGVHFFQYTDIDECIEKTHLLMENHDKRIDMMLRNRLYYKQELRPEIQIYRSILHVI